VGKYDYTSWQIIRPNVKIIGPTTSEQSHSQSESETERRTNRRKNERTSRKTIYTHTIVRGAYNIKHNYVFNKSIAFVINVTFDNAVWNPKVSWLKSFYFDKLEVYTYFWFNPTLCIIFLVLRKVSHALIIKQNFSKITFLIARLLFLILLWLLIAKIYHRNISTIIPHFLLVSNKSHQIWT